MACTTSSAYLKGVFAWLSVSHHSSAYDGTI